MKMISTAEDIVKVIASKIHNKEEFDKINIAAHILFPVKNLSPNNKRFSKWYLLERERNLEKKMKTGDRIFTFHCVEKESDLIGVMPIEDYESLEEIEFDIRELMNLCGVRILKNDIFYMNCRIKNK